MRWLVVLLLFASRLATADTIALVSDDTAFHAALDDAGGQVIVTTDKAPAISELAASSRAIADRVGATATVWLIPGTTNATLVTYDRAADRVIVRELPFAPPLDAEKATEAARMVRTMLDSLRTPDVPEVVAPHPVVVPVVPPQEPQLAFAVGGGVWLEAPAATANVVATISAAWRPDGLGATVSGTFAPAAELAMPAFTGTVGDQVIAAGVHDALRVAPTVTIAPSVGAALHMLHVAGDSLESRRFDIAARLGVGARFQLSKLSRVWTGLDVSADCLLRTQRYEAGNEEILVVPRVQVLTSVVIGIRL